MDVDTDDFLDEQTIDRSAILTVQAEAGVVGLTIAYHPRLDRIGWWVRLPQLAAGGSMEISRLAPLFTPPDASHQGKPLGDPGISRKPVTLEPTSGGFLVRANPDGGKLYVEDRAVTGAAMVPGADLDRGVTIQLGDRVVLVLHLLPAEERPSPQLGMVGESLGIRRARRAICDVADRDVPVLVRGESGTGKELVARAVHTASLRRGRFVAVNTAAIQASVASAELFGHTRGAFTGATADRKGLIQTSSGGTLFLDEVGDVPSEVQVALLRVLETGEVRPVGSRRPEPVDLRLVAATDAALEEKVDAGDFRMALLQRLSGFQITLPPLRNRREDIGRLLAVFLREELDAQGQLARLDSADRRKPPWFPARLVARMLGYAWPGNVRELRNVIRQLVIDNRSRDAFEVDAQIDELLRMGPDTEPTIDESKPPAALAPAEKKRPSDITDEELVAALEANKWRYEPTARSLGIARNSLMSLIDKSPSVRRPRDIPATEIREALEDAGGDIDRAALALGVPGRGLKRRISDLAKEG